MADTPEENLRKWELSRRQLLKIMGLAGIAAPALPLVSALTSSESGGHVHDGSHHNQAQDGQSVTANASPGRLRRWAMAIDLRYCDGCQSIGEPPRCTAACNEAHFVPEPMEWMEVYEHEIGGGGTQFQPTMCMQCQNPPCVHVCPVGATWSTPEGIVATDHDRCIGCRMCLAACPYERRFFTWGEPPIPKQALFVEYSPEHQTPMKKGANYKCDFCPEQARAGRLPFCAQACPNNAIYYGDLEEDLASNGEEVVVLSKFLADNNAYRYKEELNTQPRVHYIPGHGELVGRDPHRKGRKPTEWQWVEIVDGSKKWKRSK